MCEKHRAVWLQAPPPSNMTHAVSFLSNWQCGAQAVMDEAFTSLGEIAAAAEPSVSDILETAICDEAGTE